MQDSSKAIGSVPLLQPDLHIFKIEGHCIRLEEIVADHAREVEAKEVLPGERPIVKPRDVLFLHLPERKAMHDVGHDLQLSAATRPCGSFVFLQLDPGFLDHRLCQLDSRASQPWCRRREAQVEASPRVPSQP